VLGIDRSPENVVDCGASLASWRAGIVIRCQDSFGNAPARLKQACDSVIQGCCKNTTPRQIKDLFQTFSWNSPVEPLTQPLVVGGGYGPRAKNVPPLGFRLCRLTLKALQEPVQNRV
jgi:hypothetical protein